MEGGVKSLGGWAETVVLEAGEEAELEPKVEQAESQLGPARQGEGKGENGEGERKGRRGGRGGRGAEGV